MKNNKKKLAIAIPMILVIAIIAWIGISVYRFNSPGVHKLFKYYHVEKEGTCVIVDVDDEGIENPIESKYKLNIYFKKRKDNIMDRASGSFSVEKLEKNLLIKIKYFFTDFQIFFHLLQLIKFYHDK